MCECVRRATTSTTIIKIIANDSISDNHMRHRTFVQNHNEPFSVNELNWRKKLSSSNYQHHHHRNHDKNHALLVRAHARCHHSITVATSRHSRRRHPCRRSTNTSTNWINIRRVKAIRANRRSQPIYTTQYSDSEHTRTNLDVHFEWNSRIYFSISSKIYSRWVKCEENRSKLNYQ